MSTYEDLAHRIEGDMHAPAWEHGIRDALRWLDEHPEARPGPTITASEFERAWADSVDQDARAQYRDFLRRLGITIIPDPEPTNAEKLAAMLEAWTDEYDGRAETLTEYLDRMGVKAPEGEL